MGTDLHLLWKRLIASPEDPGVVAEARANVAALVEHVDDCAECVEASEGMTNRELVFAALSGTEEGVLTDDERVILDRMDELQAAEDRDIDTAVHQILLPAMKLSSLAEIDAGLTASELFLGIDAVNLLVRSYAARTPGARITLWYQGLMLDKEFVAPKRHLIGEISEHAEVSEDRATLLFDFQWRAVRRCPTLYRGLNVTGTDRLHVTLALTPSGSSQDLVERWAVAQAPKALEDYLLEAASMPDPIDLPKMEER